jgi:flap endonuclease-1
LVQDVLVYDAPLIKNISSRSEPLVVVSGEDVRTSLELDRPAFVDFALLLGTDFSQRIKNLGPSNAYQLIRKHGTIEQILEAIEAQPKYILKVSPDIYLAQVQIAREVFGTLPPVPPASALEAGKKSDEDITEIMQRCGLGFALLDQNWDYTAAYDSLLGGNSFEDDPRAL